MHNGDKLAQTAQIVSSHLANNPVLPEQIPSLIRDVYRTLSGLDEPEPEVLNPAVPISQSIQTNYIVCLEDGKKLKMLKRHLMTSYGLTPDQYRKRWGLPVDYPMVAPLYAQVRSALAKDNGLGRRREPVAVPAPVPRIKRAYNRRAA